jgi:uncharacterized protein YecT (DUF1311 family)
MGMPTDSSQPDETRGSAEFAPQLSKLESEYQILTELRHSADSRTYLARHLEFNRDVTITVVRAPAGDVAGESALRHFASDARSLTTMRHANVIPVIEGRWLDDGSFAIVRARVRGSTLEQVLDAAGPLSPARAAWALEQVNGALAWARANGISHRYVSASALMFQQGSGRVLLSLDPPPVATNTLPNTCDDARTVGRLATEMLGGVASSAGRGSLAELRPELPPAVIGGIDMLTHCDTNAAPPDVSAVLRSLESVGDGAAAAEVQPTPAPAAEVEPGAPSVSLPLATAAAVPVAASGDDAVVVVNRGMSFGARVATAAIVIAALIVAGVVLLRHHASPNQNASTLADTSTQSGGDIALRSSRPDTAVIDPTMVTPTIVSPPVPITTTPAPGTVPPPAMYPPAASTVPPSAAASAAASAQIDSMRAVMDSIANAARAAAVAPGRRHEPERPLVPPLRMPPPGSSSIDTTMPSSSASSTNAPPASGDVCASPAQSDQQSCAAAAKSHGDADVSAALDRVVAALRRQVNAAPGDPDPASVTRLRQAQESWRNDREAFCRDSGVAPMFGRERGRCYSDRAAARVHELQQMLDTLPQRDSTSTESVRVF